MGNTNLKVICMRSKCDGLMKSSMRNESLKYIMAETIMVQ